MATRRQPTALAPALAALLAAGCTPDFDQVWEVSDLRILAIRAEPPEVLVPAELLFIPGAIPRVHVDALVVDPRDSNAEVQWQALVCTPEEGQCRDARLSRRAHPAPTSDSEWATSTLDRIAFDVELDLELAAAAIAADPFKGFGGLPLLVELRLRGAEEVSGVKRLVYGLIDPPDKRPNSNPRLAAVQANGAAIPDQDWVVNLQSAQVLLPEAAPGAKESYVVRTFDGGTRQLEEYLSYSFFVTGGELSHALTGGEPTAVVVNKKIDDVTSEWKTPLAAGREQLWVVVRDDRGGVDWRSFVADVR